ncbi:MAG TPA: SRPBCC family protein [Alphaproteobacteria bacterium]|nr:SRPBCC family protein [Alphaproteobacteria bacterium]
MRAMFVPLVLSILIATPARAEVAQSAPGGFKVVEQVSIAAAPDKVWALLVHPEKWWSSDHTWSHDASHLRLDVRAGGCWCETWKGGSAKHMTVVYVSPGKELRLQGALGPLQWQGVSGALVFQLAADGPGSKLEMTYTVGGFSDPPLDKIASAVDEVLGEQAASLKAKAEAAH